MELDADSEVWNVPLMPGWPPALSLVPANLAGWGLLWQFFKMGRICLRRGCFYILTTRTVWPKTERETVLKRGIFASPSCKSNILLGMHFKVPAKRNMNYRFQSAKQCGDAGCSIKSYLQGFLLNMQLCSGYLEVKQFFFGSVSMEGLNGDF